MREQLSPDDLLRPAVEKAREACRRYQGSSGDAPSRDEWIKALFALQNDVGPRAMRTFVAEFGGPLPADLDSYSLFLVPDPRWRGEEYSDDLAAIWEAFYDFGRSIGDTQAAIWFLDQEDNVDVLRSQEYCRLFRPELE